VPGPARTARAKRLREAGDAARRRFLEAFTGARASVLIERDGRGHSEHFAPARIVRGAGSGTEPLPGTIVEGRVCGIGADCLLVEAPLS
jgi:threonylcarbamoyladenosine tRNA methylthiotransferase MtaB